MKICRLGVLAAVAAVGVVGSAAVAARVSADEAKACYRADCSKSIGGDRDKCGAAKVPDANDQKSCAFAHGVWMTADEAKKFQKTHDDRE